MLSEILLALHTEHTSNLKAKPVKMTNLKKSFRSQISGQGQI